MERKFHNVDGDCSVKTFTEFYIPVDDVPQVEIRNVPGGDDDESDGEQDEPEVVHNRPVGATYEENFMRETENLEARRQCKPPSRFDEECYVGDNLTADVDEPVNIHEAWTGEHSVDWKDATNSEYNSLMNNHTWDLVPPPKGKNVAGSRWVFRVKHTADGSVERFKARLVAQGYSQSQGVDYQEIFSPVVRYTSIR